MIKPRLLEGKVCLITGSGKGIGKSVAERFAEEGALVYANARTVGSIDQWASELSASCNTTVTPSYFDITDYDQVKKQILQIFNTHKRFDILVNNAGIVTYEFLGTIQLEPLRKMFEVNVIAVIQVIQLISRLMSRQKSGSIINISSIVGSRGAKGQLAYSATKGAVISITKSAAKELAASNIRVNAIAPGMVNTERFQEVLEHNFKEKINDIGMGRLASPSEIADTCVFLGSDMSTYLTGQIIEVDGSIKI